MSALQSLPITDLLQRGSIDDADVSLLRDAWQNDCFITADEAESLIALNACCPRKDPAWTVFYVEALTDYFVNQVEPEGYLTAEKARHLCESIAPKGLVVRKSDLELLISVLDQSRWSPASLSRLALEQVKCAVVHGVGPLRPAVPEATGTIREHEVDLIRRILYAYGGERPVAITRPEMEVLFDINDAIADPQANASWSDLFVKAATNVVMAASGQAVPTREEALRRDAWLMEAKGEMSPLALLSAMVSSSLDAVRATYRDQSIEERALVRLEQQRTEIITNEEIAQAEAPWLCERIGRGGRLSPNEAALVSYLERESPRMHPDLKAAVSRLAQAA